MGGGYDEPYNPQDQVYPNMRDYPYVQQEIPQIHEEVPVEFPKQIVMSIGDRIGWWTILGLSILGAFFFFRKKIKSALKNWLFEE